MHSFKKWLFQDLTEALISTSVPSNHDHTDPSKRPSFAELRGTKKLENNVDVLRNQNLYPDFHNSVQDMSHEDAAEHMIEHLKNNLLHVHDSVDPKDLQASKNWYKGANKISRKMAKRYKLRASTTAGVLSALSPQMPWDANISLAHRLLHINHHHQDTMWTPHMTKHAKRIAENSSTLKSILPKIGGKTLGDLSGGNPQETALLKAAWVRIFDEAHHPREHPLMTPDGNHTGQYNRNTTWGSLSEISKAMRIVDSDKRTGNLPDDHHVEQISKIMGDSHKTRAFLNNIYDPDSAHDDVTVDTHAVAAAHLMPLGSNATAVAHAFGNSPDAKQRSPHWESASNVGAAKHGSRGTNWLYREAYVRAAAARGIKPREMQSITWEHARSMFPDKIKKGMRAPIEAIWKRHQNGEISQQDAQRQISNYSREKKSTMTPKQNTVEITDPVAKKNLDNLHLI